MKQEIRRLTESELILFPIKGILEGWYFRIDELSVGYYRVTGINEWGRSVSRDGIDPELLFLECKNDILDILPGE